MAVFSAPPILFDIGTRVTFILNQFYQDFLEEITQSDPELDKGGFMKTLNKKNDKKEEFTSNSYRKYTLQLFLGLVCKLKKNIVATMQSMSQPLSSMPPFHLRNK